MRAPSHGHGWCVGGTGDSLGLRELTADVRQRHAPIFVLRSRTATCRKAAGSLTRENRGGEHRALTQAEALKRTTKESACVLSVLAPHNAVHRCAATYRAALVGTWCSTIDHSRRACAGFSAWPAPFGRNCWYAAPRIEDHYRPGTPQCRHCHRSPRRHFRSNQTILSSIEVKEAVRCK